MQIRCVCVCVCTCATAQSRIPNRISPKGATDKLSSENTERWEGKGGAPPINAVYFYTHYNGLVEGYCSFASLNCRVDKDMSICYSAIKTLLFICESA